MRKIKILFISLILVVPFFSRFTAQEKSDMDNLKIEIKKIEEEITRSKIINKDNNLELLSFKNKLVDLNAKIDSLNQIRENQSKETKILIEKVDSKLDRNFNNTAQDINTINDSIGKRTFYWILTIFIILSISIILFFVLRNRISKNKKDVFDTIKEATDKIKNDQFRLDEDLIKLLDTQMKVMQEERKVTNNSNIKLDHSLALKVADEIIRIQQNISFMDPNAKGLKQINLSVKRIQDNFESNGYEIVNMLNKPYDEGMKVIANFRPDENLKSGEQIITRIIKPQVNFKGIMVQSAQVEVSQGE